MNMSIQGTVFLTLQYGHKREEPNVLTTHLDKHIFFYYSWKKLISYQVTKIPSHQVTKLQSYQLSKYRDRQTKSGQISFALTSIPFLNPGGVA